MVIPKAGRSKNLCHNSRGENPCRMASAQVVPPRCGVEEGHVERSKQWGGRDAHERVGMSVVNTMSLVTACNSSHCHAQVDCGHEHVVRFCWALGEGTPGEHGSHHSSRANLTASPPFCLCCPGFAPGLCCSDVFVQFSCRVACAVRVCAGLTASLSPASHRNVCGNAHLIRQRSTVRAPSG